MSIYNNLHRYVTSDWKVKALKISVFEFSGWQTNTTNEPVLIVIFFNLYASNLLFSMEWL